MHGDTNVLPTTLLLKVGTTSLVLDQGAISAPVLGLQGSGRATFDGRLDDLLQCRSRESGGEIYIAAGRKPMTRLTSAIVRCASRT